MTKLSNAINEFTQNDVDREHQPKRGFEMQKKVIPF